MTDAVMAQVVEHVLGKDEVGSSSLPSSSKKKREGLCWKQQRPSLFCVQAIFIVRGDLRSYSENCMPVQEKHFLHIRFVKAINPRMEDKLSFIWKQNGCFIL